MIKIAHFAKIENGVVTQVVVVDNKDCNGGDFPGADSAGNAFLNSIGLSGTWKQTSYNNNFRSKYAGVGDKYDAEADAFVSPVSAEDAPLEASAKKTAAKKTTAKKAAKSAK